MFVHSCTTSFEHQQKVSEGLKFAANAFFTVSGSTLLRENVFIRVLVYPDFLLALEPGEKKLRQEKKVRGRRKKFQAGEKGFFFLLVRDSGFRLTRL